MFTLGLAIAPRRVYRAFVRGRHCTSLYRIGWSDELLLRDVRELQRELGLDQAHASTWRDRAAFAAFLALLALPAASLIWLVC